MEIGGFAGHAYRYLAEDGGVKSTAAAASVPATSACSTPMAFCCLTGREKELIIRGGVNISPLEIDSFLMQRPEVIEVATVGVPDATYGEEVVSYVVARPGAAIDAGDACCAIAATACPPSRRQSGSCSRTSLPKTERGKLDRRALGGALGPERAMISPGQKRTPTLIGLRRPSRC